MLKLSVIIPYYKGANFLTRLLESIFKSYSRVNGRVNLEIIVVIDCNTAIDIVLAKVHSAFGDEQLSHIKVIQNEQNQGVARTRNKGFKLSTGDYIHFIDQDDEVSADFFETILPYLGEKDFILSNGMIIDTDNGIQYQLYNLKPVISLRKLILKSFIRSPGQVVIKRSLIDNVRFAAAHKYFGADDKFFWIDIFLSTENIKAGYIHKCLYMAHKHSGNYSNNYRELSMSCLELWEQFRPRMKSRRNNALMNQDIRIQRFILSQFDSVSDRFICCWDFLMYKVDPNSLIRFINKSLKKIYAKR